MRVHHRGGLMACACCWWQAQLVAGSMSGIKSCVQCAQLKPAADFHAEARSPDGLTNKCKECRRMKQVCVHPPALSAAHAPQSSAAVASSGDLLPCRRERVCL